MSSSNISYLISQRHSQIIERSNLPSIRKVQYPHCPLTEAPSLNDSMVNYSKRFNLNKMLKYRSSSKQSFNHSIIGSNKITPQENMITIVIAKNCDNLHQKFKQLHFFQVTFTNSNKANLENIPQFLIQQLQSSLKSHQINLSIQNFFIHNSYGSVIDTLEDLLHEQHLLFICKHAKLLDFNSVPLLKMQNYQDSIKLTVNCYNERLNHHYQSQYDSMLSELHRQQPMKSSMELRYEFPSELELDQYPHVQIKRSLKSDMSRGKILKNSLSSSTQFSENMHNFITTRRKVSQIQESQQYSMIDYTNNNTLQRNVSSLLKQNTNNKSFDDLNNDHSYSKLNITNDNTLQIIEDKECKLPIPKKSQRSVTPVRKPQSTSQSARLENLERRLRKYRLHRVKEAMHQEQQLQENLAIPESVVIESINKYFTSKEYQSQQLIQKKIFKIPESKTPYEGKEFKKEQLPKMRKQVNKSTFIIKPPQLNNSQRSLSTLTNLQQNFLEHASNPLVIKTFKDKSFPYTQKPRPKDQVDQYLANKKMNVSNFDSRQNALKRKIKKRFKDFMRQNTYNAIGERSSLERVVQQNFKPLIELNIPQLEKQTGFCRKDLFNIYTHFLSIFRIQQSERQHLKSEKVNDLTGIDLDVFKDNVPILKYENKEVAEKIIKNIKNDIQGGQIQWDDFLKYLRMMLAQSFSEKIDIFFYVFDVDKNSQFSWDEVKTICTSCLSQMFSSQDEFVDSLSLYFTKFIFEAVGYGPGDEIPFEMIKNAIKSADSEHGELLQMFVGVDQFKTPQSNSAIGINLTKK